MTAVEQVTIPHLLGDIRAQKLILGQDRFIFYIEDAHAILDAQDHIQDLIGYLHREYGVRLVALEGGEGALDATLFRAFPNEAAKKRVFRNYLKNGELTGAEMAAVFHSDRLDYFGIEDWNLYEENYLAYLHAEETKEETLKELETRKRDLDARRKHVYSPQLNEFHEKLKAFRNEDSNLLEFLNDVIARQRAKRFPHPSLRGGAPGNDEAILDREIASANAWDTGLAMTDGDSASAITTAWMHFNERHQAFLTGRLDAASFLTFLAGVAESLDLPLSLSPLMKTLVSRTQRLSRIKGTKLFDELESFIGDIQAGLISKPEEEAIAAEYEELYLVEQLAKLELTRTQWDVLKGCGMGSAECGVRNVAWRMNLLRTPPRKIAFGNLEAGPRREALFGPHSQLRILLAPHLHFYKLVEARDQAMQRNLSALLDREKAVNAIVIAGGFHTEGFRQAFEREGISYAIISPKINSLEGENAYEHLMHGNFSYKPYFETTFYDAFAKAASVQLAGELNGLTFRRDIKVWRDEVIRKLAGEKRLADASEYTRYIDRLMSIDYEKNRDKTYEEILNDIRNEIARYRDPSLAAVWDRFEFQLKTFADGLRDLLGRKELNVASVTNLVDRIAHMKPSTMLHPSVPAFIPGARFHHPELREFFDTGKISAVDGKNDTSRGRFVIRNVDQRAKPRSSSQIEAAEKRRGDVELEERRSRKLNTLRFVPRLVTRVPALKEVDGQTNRESENTQSNSRHFKRRHERSLFLGMAQKPMSQLIKALIKPNTANRQFAWLARRLPAPVTVAKYLAISMSILPVSYRRLRFDIATFHSLLYLAGGALSIGASLGIWKVSPDRGTERILAGEPISVNEQNKFKYVQSIYKGKRPHWVFFSDDAELHQFFDTGALPKIRAPQDHETMRSELRNYLRSSEDQVRVPRAEARSEAVVEVDLRRLLSDRELDLEVPANQELFRMIQARQDLSRRYVGWILAARRGVLEKVALIKALQDRALFNGSQIAIVIRSVLSEKMLLDRLAQLLANRDPDRLLLLTPYAIAWILWRRKGEAIPISFLKHAARSLVFREYVSEAEFKETPKGRVVARTLVGVSRIQDPAEALMVKELEAAVGDFVARQSGKELEIGEHVLSSLYELSGATEEQGRRDLIRQIAEEVHVSPEEVESFIQQLRDHLVQKGLHRAELREFLSTGGLPASGYRAELRDHAEGDHRAEARDVEEVTEHDAEREILKQALIHAYGSILLLAHNMGKPRFGVERRLMRFGLLKDPEVDAAIRNSLKQALIQAGGNIRQLAQNLRKSESTVRLMLKRFDLSLKDPEVEAAKAATRTANRDRLKQAFIEAGGDVSQLARNLEKSYHAVYGQLRRLGLLLNFH